MRGHCTCKAPENFSDKHDASGELVDTCLGIEATHKVLHLLALRSNTIMLELVGKFRDGHVSNQNVAPFGILAVLSTP